MNSASNTSILARIAYIGHVNIFAFIAGVVTLYLVIQSEEIILLVSNIVEGDYVSIGLGNVDISLFGRSIEVPILDYLVISSKLSYLVASISLIAGSLVKDEELSKGLIGFKLPSMTGLILAVIALIVMYLGGIINPINNEVSVVFTFNIAGQVYSIPISYSLRPTINTYLALFSNLMAILGRLAVKNRANYIEKIREISISMYLPI